MAPPKVGYPDLLDYGDSFEDRESMLKWYKTILHDNDGIDTGLEVQWGGGKYIVHPYLWKTSAQYYDPRVKAWGAPEAAHVVCIRMCIAHRLRETNALCEWMWAILNNDLEGAEFIFWRFAWTDSVCQKGVPRGTDWKEVFTPNWPHLDEWGLPMTKFTQSWGMGVTF